jgi:hypothetical protein
MLTITGMEGESQSHICPLHITGKVIKRTLDDKESNKEKQPRIKTT